MAKKNIVRKAASGGVVDVYGPKFRDGRNRMPVTVAKDAKGAVDAILCANKNK
jgi:hypothetical protein